MHDKETQNFFRELRKKEVTFFDSITKSRLGEEWQAIVHVRLNTCLKSF